VKTRRPQGPAAPAPEPAAEVIAARQGEHRYEVHVGPGALAPLAGLVAEHDGVAIFTARPVLRTAFARGVVGTLESTGRLRLVHVLPDGERGKTLAELGRAAGALLAAGATRRALVVALGGGAVSDAAGFAAATFMRGVPWLVVPTTLLAMVDAAIGGKTGVNLPAMKNAVGAFHPPRAVLADPAALVTLPPRELRSGLGEVAKYALLDPRLLARVTALAGGAPGPDLVAACARAKVDVVERDPMERGARKLLNLGHTFGHGVEAAGGFRRYTHGEAVSIGVTFAFRLAARLGRIGPLAVAEVEDALAGLGLPVRVGATDARRAAALMTTDKKRTAAGLRWVLPRADGEAWTVDWDVAADAAAVAETVREVVAPRPRRVARRRAGV
jgi:3-dehydroquinate synthase